MKTIATAFIGLLALASPVLAQSGFDLRWDTCAAQGGTVTKTIDCHAGGAERLVGTFVADADIRYAAFEVVLDVVSDAPLPDYWNPGGCIQMAVYGGDPGFTCPPFTLPPPSIVQHVIAPLGGDPKRNRVVLWGDVDPSVTFPAGSERALFTVEIGRSPDCIDCYTPFHLALREVVFFDCQGAVLAALTRPLRADSAVAIPVFPPRGDDLEPSMGRFRVVVEPEFWPMMAGYPGFDVVDGVHRLVSPVLNDRATRIGRSDVHLDGSAEDAGGTPVGSAGTLVSDASFVRVPPGFEGPTGTTELHTEVRELALRDFAGTAVRAGAHAPDRPISPGEIETRPDAAGPLPGESFFNVFVEVDLPMLGGNPGVDTLYTPDPVVIVNDSLTRIPPRVVYIHKHTGPVPIVFKHDDPSMPPKWSRGDRLGWLVLAGHGYQFDGAAAAREAGAQPLTDAVKEFLEIVEAEPEMADSATLRVDLLDVVTFADPGAFAGPDKRDSLLAGLDAAAGALAAGDPCGAMGILIELRFRADGEVSPAEDWVLDETIRQLLHAKMTALAEEALAAGNQQGGCAPTGVTPAIPARVAIQDIRPNPTAGSTTIRYGIPGRSRVRLDIYDVNGRRVRTLVDADLAAGVHQATWDGRRQWAGGVPSGIYFARLTATGATGTTPEITDTRRIVIVR